MKNDRWIGAIEHNSHSGLMWNIALDGSGNPKLPGTNSCGGPGCRAIATVNSNGTYSLNEECAPAIYPYPPPALPHDRI